MKRNKHSLSHYKLATFDMGELIPVSCFEVLPGDSIQQATSALLRVSPLVAPVMHPVSVRIHHWYVPNRLVFPQWEDFITGGPDGLGGGAVYPTIGPFTMNPGTLPDYFGIPTGIAGVVVSALPIRAYNLIYNEFYRDQDLVAVVAEDSRAVQKVAWEKDRFAGARPWPQKGPAVTLPLGTTAPVTSDVAAGAGLSVISTAQGGVLKDMGTGGASLTQGGTNGAVGSGLYANLAAASAVNVNDVRRAFALQRYQEARAMYGSRFTEYLRYLGVRSSDARLQLPEYLGGGKQTISFSEVLQTAPGTDAVGTMKGHGIAAIRSRRYRRFFEEHGHVISLMSVRPRTMYINGLDKMWNRRTKEDYWQKELEHIGQEEIRRKEVYFDNTAGDETVFGYADRYNSYRHIDSKVAGDFRTTLNYWHLARDFGAAPTLNQAFVECVPSKRIHAVQTADVLWVMIANSVQARRMVSRSNVGRIV